MVTSEFEEVLSAIGDFGPFQICVFILVSMFETPAAWAIFLPVFIARKPDWMCVQSSSFDLSTNASRALTVLQVQGTERGSNYSEPLNSTEVPLDDEEAKCALYKSENCEEVLYLGNYSSIISDVSFFCANCSCLVD